jgi:arylsulfatase A-like enzyme
MASSSVARVQSTPRSLLPRPAWLSPLCQRLGAVLVFVFFATAGAAQAQTEEATGPNVIVVMSDDQAPGMMRALPTVRRELGARGATFTNAFATFPLCCPARATLLTGQYAHNHGTLGNNPLAGGGYRALEDPERNLAAWLRAGGYDTAFAGKWLNGLRMPRHAPPGWNLWAGLVGAGGEGLSSYYDYEIFNAFGKPTGYGSTPADYQTDALTRDYALPYIAGQAAVPGPFFLWLAYHPPHAGTGRDDAAGRRCSDGPPAARSSKQSAIPPPRYARAYQRTAVPRSPAFDERDVSDKPKFIARRPPLSDRDLETIDRDYRCGLAALRALDDAVAAIVAELRATAQYDDTVIAFLPDQGVMGGEHRIKRGKNVPYEEAIRIPLLMRGPGIAPGTVIDAPVANADLAPTILDLAGVTPPPELSRPVDGTSQRPALAGALADPGRAILIEGRDNTAKSRHGYKVRSYVGVRTARYAYFEHRRASYGALAQGIAAPIGAGRTVERELYDLARDPNQLRNAIRDERYRAAKAELAVLTEALERCSGPSCAVTAAVPAPAR